MKPGTIIQLADGRIGTVIYHGLDGYGLKWGEHMLPDDFIEKANGIHLGEPPTGWEWFAEAMLRDPYPGSSMECVGEEYEVVTKEPPC